MKNCNAAVCNQRAQCASTTNRGAQAPGDSAASTPGKVDCNGQKDAANKDAANKTAESQLPMTEEDGVLISSNSLRGLDNLRDPRLNKGMAFTIEERQILGIHGLLPPSYRNQDQQKDILHDALVNIKTDLEKFTFLEELRNRNEKLFYRFLAEYVEETMPIVYTPTVGLACQTYGLIFRRPRGMFITIKDKGYVFDVVKNWPEPHVKVIVVTDGERILGLGDLGAHGMHIPIGKLTLYSALAGIKPHQCLPVVLDYGTNNEKFLVDPTYVGLKQKRETGPAVDELVDEFMQAIVRRFGPRTLIQFEDFANHNAFKFLDKYKDIYCTFNDDIQGTGSVTVAGLMASERMTNIPFTDYKILFFGAGEASTGVANMLVYAAVMRGFPEEKARDNIWLFDIDGLIVKGRSGPIQDSHKPYVKDFKHITTLIEAVKEIKPTALIGASTVGKAFNEEVIKTMTENNPRPVIFALSNPTHKAECTAEEAYTISEGKAIFASGSPFPPFTYNNKTFRPGQGNNAFIFPGVGLGVIVGGLDHVPMDLFLIAAETLAKMLTPQEIDEGSVFPSVAKIKDVSIEIATNILLFGLEKGIASVYPVPADKRDFVIKSMYKVEYESAIPPRYDFPLEENIQNGNGKC